MKDFELSITPVEAYNAPEIPMLMSDNSALLKKLPSRWQKNVKVIACIGVIGSFTLTGCMPLFSRLHGGGGLPTPIYVVHFTEQEALGIIRARLEEAGLDFNFEPPKYTIDWDWYWGEGEDELALDLIDEQKNVAVIYRVNHGPPRRNFDMQIEEAFRVQIDNITVGVFLDRGSTGSDTDHRQQLNSQADVFVAFLQSEGILERQQEINVLINGEPIEFDIFPVILNNQVMVPSPAIFEALGMEVEGDYSRGAVSATKDSLSIEISPGLRSMRVNGRWVNIDTPTVMRGNRILVPLQPIAEAVGASMEWDEDMTTIRINTN